MKRRDVLVELLLAAVAALSAAEAQEPTKTPLVGVLFGGAPARSPPMQGFLDGLRELGYVDGQNIRIEFRSAEGKIERLPALAAELVALKPTVIVSSNAPATRAVKDLTRTVPVVMVNTPDPVQLGIVASLARPGGNVTGLTDNVTEMLGKQVQLLKELLPQATDIVFLWNPLNPGSALGFAEAQRAGAGMGLHVRSLPVHGPEELQNTLEQPISPKVDGMIVLVEPLLYRFRSLIIEFASRYRVPVLYGYPDVVAEGGLIAYGANIVDLYRRAATYVDKILKGAKPADLPIEQPTRLYLAINLKAAKALGLAIPPALLARADEVIE